MDDLIKKREEFLNILELQKNDRERKKIISKIKALESRIAEMMIRELMLVGYKISYIAEVLGVTTACLGNWLRKDRTVPAKYYNSIVGVYKKTIENGEQMN